MIKGNRVALMKLVMNFSWKAFSCLVYIIRREFPVCTGMNRLRELLKPGIE